MAQLASKSQVLTPQLKDLATAKRLTGVWRLIRGYRLPYFGAGLSLGVATAARTGSLLLVRYFIDSYLDQGARTYALWMIAIAFVGLAATQGAFTFLSGTLAARTAEGIVQRLRNYLLDHIQRLTFAYHDEVQTGELVQRVTSDVDALRRFFAAQAIESSRILFLFAINFAAIYSLNQRLAWISVIVIPFIVALSVFFFRLVSRAYEKYQEEDAVLTTTLQENLTGVRVVKAFARQEYESAKFEITNLAKYKKGRRLLLMHSLYWPFSDILSAAQMLTGFAVGAMMAINGTITVGTYVAYTGMLLLIIWPMRNLGRLVVEMSRGLVSLERVTNIIRQDREVMEEPDFVAPDGIQGDIVFDNVSFAYRTEDKRVTEPPVRSLDDPLSSGNSDLRSNGHKLTGDSEPSKGHHAVALQNISFHVRPGQRVALMGATGAGKTTLVNLLPRFYDYSSGRILLDGIELKKYSRSFLRDHIGIVEQEPFLFSKTVRENIAYSVGRDVSQQEIEDAAKVAAIHEVIMTKLPHGYDTLVGERGTTLSGGQKQRVAIARTLLKNPRILILDDSTSSVDTETEASIQEALDQLMENRTTFVIAHRIQTVMNADLILVLAQGRIIQVGKHEELLEKDGMYRRIFAAQTRIEDELHQELNRV